MIFCWTLVCSLEEGQVLGSSIHQELGGFPLHFQGYLGLREEVRTLFSPRANTITIWGCFSQGLRFPAPNFCLLGHSRAQWPLSSQYAPWFFSRVFLSLFVLSLFSLLSPTTAAKILCKFLSCHFSFLISLSSSSFLFLCSFSVYMVDFFSNLY